MSSAPLDDFTLLNFGFPLQDEPLTTLDTLARPGTSAEGSFGALAFDDFPPPNPLRPLPIPPRSFSGPPFAASISQDLGVIGDSGIGSSLGGFEGAKDGERGWFDLLGTTLPQDTGASRSLPSTLLDASSSLSVSPLASFGNLSIFEPSLPSASGLINAVAGPSSYYQHQQQPHLPIPPLLPDASTSGDTESFQEGFSFLGEVFGGEDGAESRRRDEDEERKERRRATNRSSAKAFRLRKNAKLAADQQLLAAKDTEASDLRDQVEALQRENAALRREYSSSSDASPSRVEDEPAEFGVEFPQ